jgi:SSS family solute:Na+ symporter
VKRLYVWSSIGFMIRFIVPQFLGICALALLWSHPEGRAVYFPNGQLADDAEVTMRAMPVLLGHILPVGLVGLVGAGMLAAFMSTHDSYLLCWSSVIVQDVIDPLCGGRLGTKARLAWARTLIFLIGVFLLVWSLWYPLEQDLWDYMAVSGSIYYIGAFVLLVGGIYWQRASSAGAYAALGCGVLGVFGLTQLRELLAGGVAWMAGWEKPPGITEAHVVLTVVSLATVAMVVGSLVFPDRKTVAGHDLGENR